MTTIDYSNYDFLAGAVENQEYEHSSWHNDQRTFARTERRCIKVYQREKDDSQEVIMHALENVISMIVSRAHSYRFGFYYQWEADFFDTFLDTPLLRKNLILMSLIIEIFVCVKTTTLLSAALKRK